MRLSCPAPGCATETEEFPEAAQALEMLKLHVSLVHGGASKPEKPRRPSLSMTGDVVEHGVWAAFKHQFSTYKSLANISGQAVNHLLECLAPEVYRVLFDTYGESLSQMTEVKLLENIEHLIVQKRNSLISVMDMMSLRQDSNQKFLSFLAQLKAKARMCQFSKNCSCGLKVDYTEEMVLCRLVSGVYDHELQEELLKKEKLTLKQAEELGVAKESAKSSQSEISTENNSKLSSQYQRNKFQQDPKSEKCKWCGGDSHTDREKECKAFSQDCRRCGKTGHFKKVCRSKVKRDKDLGDKNEAATADDEEGSHMLFTVKSEEVLSSISTADLYWDKKSKRWIQRPSSLTKTDTLAVQLSTSRHDISQLSNRQLPESVQQVMIDVKGIADTGCSTLCAGDNIRSKLRIPRSCLMSSSVTLRTADGKKLTVMGALPVEVSVPGTTKSSKQVLHIVKELTGLFLSKLCLSDLGSISSNFPLPDGISMASISTQKAEQTCGAVLAECGCPRRERAPDPPALPFPAVPENIQKLKNFIINHYSTSTMNLCPHQKLPECDGPPLHFTLKPGAVPHAVYTPATIPVHWGEVVKAQIDRDVELGILTPVPPNEPAIWQHRMVVVKKHNGTPRRTVDMKKLNDASLRHSYPMLSPYQKAMTVPANSYKTVTDAWEGYHSVPLDEESSKMTRFITPWGSYRYLRGPQGYESSGDAYNLRYDEITEGVKNIIRQVDDSLLYDPTIADNFRSTVDYFTLTGRAGILQSPAKFQFCQQEVTWSGFVIGKDFVKPMNHISSSIRNFPVPANRTDLRSYMALVQQVSYAVAVAPQLLPFRKLLKRDEKWNWTPELNTLFLASRMKLADKVEEGMKTFDPNRPTALISDFCKHGVGYVLQQKHCHCPLEDSHGRLNALCCKQGWRVCMVGSRFTQQAESRYSPTEGELLGVYNALHKTRYFTLGCPHLYVGTDHKPLLGLLENTDLDSIDNPRLVKLKEKTFRWSFKITYIPGKQIGGTDALSRYGVIAGEEGPDLGTVEEPSARKHLISLLVSASDELSDDELLVEDDCVIMSLSRGEKPIQWHDVQVATAKDQSMQDLSRVIRTSFPEQKSLLPESIQQFWNVRGYLRVLDGVILYGDRIVIPVNLRKGVLEVLHSAHQGTTGMILRASSAVYWPGMHDDISKTRASCWTCNSTAPSQPNMPPVTPETPNYPFQHLSSDYFQLNNHHYLVVVDRYSGWFNIYQGSGGAKFLINCFTRLFQDVGIAESVTTDGGTTYTSDAFRDCMKQFGVHHRISSVGFPHGNTRGEVAVKTAKRLLRDHLNPVGDLDTVAVTKALLQHRNTPDRDLGVSPAELLFGRKLKDYLPSRPNEPPNSLWPNFRQEWKDTAHWRELALQRRSSKIQEKLLEHTKNLEPLKINDAVFVQNQLGNNPKRWDKRGTIIEVLPHRQYKVRMDGSRKISLRNRQFLRKFTPLDQRTPSHLHSEQQSDHREPLTPAVTNQDLIIPDKYDTEFDMEAPRSGNDDNVDLPVLMYPAPDTTPATPRNIAPRHHSTQAQTSPPHPPPVPTQVIPPVGGGRVGGGEGSTSPVRRSSRTTRGQSTRFEDFVTGDQFDNATTGIGCIACSPHWYGSTTMSSEGGQVLYAYKLPAGYEEVSYMWDGMNWEMLPPANYAQCIYVG